MGSHHTVVCNRIAKPFPPRSSEYCSEGQPNPLLVPSQEIAFRNSRKAASSDCQLLVPSIAMVAPLLNFCFHVSLGLGLALASAMISAAVLPSAMVFSPVVVTAVRLLLGAEVDEVRVCSRFCIVSWASHDFTVAFPTG